MATPERAPATVNHVGDLPITARNASLSDLATMLKDQNTRKVDVVAPAPAIRSKGGVWVVDGAEPTITADGVTDTAGRYRPTAVADEGLADKLGVPIRYLRKLREERPDLYDANVNGWLRGAGTWERHTDDYRQVGVRRRIEDEPGPDPRSFLVRAFRVNGTGVARAFLSDRYRIVDNLDVLTAALEGVKASGVDVSITACDLTDRRMYVKVAAPAVAELAPDLLANYRSPFTGDRGEENPTVFAGFVISNSETGGGAMTITPRLTVEVCDNGMTISKDALRHVHLGRQLDEGVIRWSDETQQRNLDLVASQARDAVATFLDVDYVRGALDRIRATAGTEVGEPAKVVQHVAKALTFGQDAADGILDHFIRGGDTTAGGVMHAVTSYAQTVEDADRAAELEAGAVAALELAAR